MNYRAAFNFPFAHPRWGMNLLFGALCQIIPVVGPIVFLGYGADVLAVLIARPGSVYPAFDFHQFTRYLTRGVWPFLVALVASFAAMPVVGGCAILPLVGLIFALRDSGPASVLAVVFVVIALILVLAFLLPVLLLPLTLRAMLVQDFAASFSWPFYRGFLARTWKQCFLVQLVLAAVVLVLFPVLACTVILSYFAAPLLYLVQWHLLAQLYELYLRRGGTPVPFKEPPPGQYGVPGPAFPVVPR